MDDFAFIDLGCGKSKAALLARELQILGNDPQDYLGIDFSEDLIEIAKLNCDKILQDIGNFLVQDILEIDWAKLPEKVLVYAHNPIDELILRNLLIQVENKHVIAIYLNPIYKGTFLLSGFFEFYKKQSWHGNLSLSLMTNNQKLLREVSNELL